MLRQLGTLTLAFVGCAGPSTEVPPNEIQRQVVDSAVELAEACDTLDDLTSLSWSWAQLCWHRRAPEIERGRAALEGCRASAVERGLVAVGPSPAQVDLAAPLSFDANCPPDPPTQESQLQVYSDIDYPVEEGASIEITFTNFCDDDIEYGFAPDTEGSPPITWQLQPLTRRKITIPRNYGLRARLAHEQGWSEMFCTASRNGAHLTFDADCSSCTAGRLDPLRKADCVEAGSCPAPGAR
jgi:hypothetical protein